MARLRLRIAVGATVHAYSDNDLLAGEIAVQEIREGLRIEMGDARLGVPASGIRADGTPRTFLDTADPLTLPDDEGEGFRAVLEVLDAEDEVERVLLDGLVYREDVDYDEPTRTFGFMLIGASDIEMWRLLRAVRLRNMSAPARALIEYRTADVWTISAATIPAPDGTVSDARTDFAVLPNRRWHELASLARAVLAEAGIAGGPERLFSFPTRYADGEEVKTLTREARLYVLCERNWTIRSEGVTVSDTLPEWTGTQVVEAAQAAGGFVLRPSFALFPSRALSVAVIEDRWEDAEDIPALEERTLQESYEVFYEAAADKGAAVAYANDVGEASYERRPMTGPDGLGLYSVSVPFPAYAVFAGAQWEVEPQSVRSAKRKQGEEPAQERRPKAESLTELPFHLPQVALFQGQVPYFVQPDPEDPLYVEGVLGGPPLIAYEKDAVYLSAFETITLGALNLELCVLEREVFDPAEGQAARFCESWAGAMLEARGLSRAKLVGASGRFYVDGLDFSVGDPTQGLLLRDVPWMVTRAEVGEDGDASLELRRPASGPLPVPALPPSPPGPVTSLVALRLYGVNPQGERDGDSFAYVRWSPPPAAECSAHTYEVEVNQGSGFVPLSSLLRATEVFVGVVGALPAGAVFRVRAIAYDGQAGPWTTTNAAASLTANGALTIELVTLAPEDAEVGDTLTAVFLLHRDGDRIREAEQVIVRARLDEDEGLVVSEVEQVIDGTRRYAARRYTARFEAIDAGPARVLLIEAEDTTGAEGELSMLLDVSEENDPPAFTSVPPTTPTNAGEDFEYTPVATDADAGDDIEIVATRLPSWLTFDGAALSGTAPAVTSVTEYPVELLATDHRDGAPRGGRVVQAFNVIVQPAGTLTITSTPPTTVVEGATYTYNVTTGGGTDPLVLVASAPAWLGFTDYGDGTGTLTGTAPAVTSDETYGCAIEVTDALGRLRYQFWDITVAPL